jgi:hypothetical protein
MYSQEILQKNHEVSYPVLKSWILDNIPNFSEHLVSRDDIATFKQKDNIAKVYLLSTKQ